MTLQNLGVVFVVFLVGCCFLFYWVGFSVVFFSLIFTVKPELLMSCTFTAAERWGLVWKSGHVKLKQIQANTSFLYLHYRLAAKLFPQLNEHRLQLGCLLFILSKLGISYNLTVSSKTAKIRKDYRDTGEQELRSQTNRIAIAQKTLNKLKEKILYSEQNS